LFLPGYLAGHPVHNLFFSGIAEQTAPHPKPIKRSNRVREWAWWKIGCCPENRHKTQAARRDVGSLTRNLPQPHEKF
jgi:hypothetical protein